MNRLARAARQNPGTDEHGSGAGTERRWRDLPRADVRRAAAPSGFTRPAWLRGFRLEAGTPRAAEGGAGAPARAGAGPRWWTCVRRRAGRASAGRASWGRRAPGEAGTMTCPDLTGPTCGQPAGYFFSNSPVKYASRSRAALRFARSRSSLASASRRFVSASAVSRLVTTPAA